MAINHLKGHLRIIACPGSGKTEAVSRRIVRLIEEGADPKSIVAFTFTEKAADELKARVRRILEERLPDRADFGDMFVGTIHAFCFFMLKEMAPEYRAYDVLTDEKRVAFVTKFWNWRKIGLGKLKTKHSLRHYQTILRFLYSCDIMMTEDIDSRRLSDRTFARCYENYRQLLDEEKYFDFSSVMATLVHELRDDKVKRRFVRDRVKHVVVDEYQDINWIQEKLVESLSEGAESLCVVGDDDQNIYHWRGSDVGIIRSFKKRYGKKFKLDDVNLSTNFRSTNAIVFTANSFIRHNKERLPKDMISNPSLKREAEKGDIIHGHFQNEGEELKFIAGKIRELRGTDFLDKRNSPYSLSYGDFAVLSRSNDEAAKVTDFLKGEGIPCIAYSGKSVFESGEVRLAMNCIAFTFGVNRYPDYKRGVPSLADLVTWYRSVFDRAKFPNANSTMFAAKMKKLKAEMKLLRAKDPKDYFGDLGLQGIYYKILAAVGADRFDFGEVISHNLATLSRAISDYESVWRRLRASEVGWFFPFVYAYADGAYEGNQNSDISMIDAVNVLTIHKAKGLEFPVVFIPGFEKKQPGWKPKGFVDNRLYDIDKYGGTEEDERRVFYTAITRSEKYLFMTGSVHHDGAKKSYQPHPFIDEMSHKFFSRPIRLRKRQSGLPERVRTVGIYPTSYSELMSYERCPQEFKLRHVYEYNAGVPVTFGYGTNIHNTLNVIHSDYVRTNKVPTDSEIKKTVDRTFKLRYATNAIAKGMKKAAIRVVKNYVRLNKDGFRRILETEKRFEFALDQALISGSIDLLKKVDRNGNVTDVEIIDFKTDKKDSIYTPNYKKQLRFYAIACLESLGLRPQKAFVHHLDEGKRVAVDVSGPKLKTTKKEVRDSVSHILSRKFPARPEGKKCWECDYRAICSYRK